MFPRLNERDPYKCLGISKEASYEEIQDARNYLVETYKVGGKLIDAECFAEESVATLMPQQALCAVVGYEVRIPCFLN